MINCKKKADTKLTVVMWSRRPQRRPQRHLAAVSAVGDLLASYLSTWLGTSAAQTLEEGRFGE